MGAESIASTSQTVNFPSNGWSEATIKFAEMAVNWTNPQATPVNHTFSSSQGLTDSLAFTHDTSSSGTSYAGIVGADFSAVSTFDLPELYWKSNTTGNKSQWVANVGWTAQGSSRQLGNLTGYADNSTAIMNATIWVAGKQPRTVTFVQVYAEVWWPCM